MQLTNKHILLTGASGGIGQAIAKSLDAEGAILLLAGRNKEKLQQLTQSLTGQHHIVLADMNTPEGRDVMIRMCQQHGLDLFINASGVLDFQLYDKQQPECVEQILTTNLVSPMLLCQRLIPLLAQRDEATLVNIGSIFGSIGHPGFTAYCASKFGLRGFTEALQRELADSTVRVCYLAPRATKTDLNSTTVTALNQALGNATDTPEHVANALMDLLSSHQKHYFMGWPEKLFVFLNSLFPRLVHNALVKKLPIIRQYAQQQ